MWTLLLAACDVPLDERVIVAPSDTGTESDTDTDTDADTDSTEPVVICPDADATMTFTPEHPVTGEVLTVAVSSPTPYAYIGMGVAPPIGWTELGSTLSGSGPYTWTYDYTLDVDGRFDFHFTGVSGAVTVCTGSVWARESTSTSGDVPPANPFGIGLVGPGNSSQWDRAAELAGRGGHVKLIFPGMVPGMSGPEPDWTTAVQASYDRDLVPVIRMSPPWGSNHVRGWSDPGDPHSYTDYAQSFANVVAGLPRRGDWPLWIEVHNEPNLCYEWTCDPGELPSGWQTSADIAAEYAALLRDVANAVHALGDPRVKVINAGLAPGGVTSCECGGDGWTGGETSLDFIDHMQAAVPGVFGLLDGFATHSYPMNNPGYDFFLDYPQSGLGLHWWEDEVVRAGVPTLPVLITETGWTVGAGDFPSRTQVADRTELAWQNDWFGEPRIEAVMPFMLQDGAWDDFAWVDGANTPYEVFTRIRDYRCGMAFPDPC